jgi:hypothetical protein
MAALWLLSVAATIEAATGVALIIYPQAVAKASIHVYVRWALRQ